MRGQEGWRVCVLVEKHKHSRQIVFLTFTMFMCAFTNTIFIPFYSPPIHLPLCLPSGSSKRQLQSSSPIWCMSVWMSSCVSFCATEKLTWSTLNVWLFFPSLARLSLSPEPAAVLCVYAAALCSCRRWYSNCAPWKVLCRRWSCRNTSISPCSISVRMKMTSRGGKKGADYLLRWPRCRQKWIIQ